MGRYLIYGAGAIGSVFGGMLAKAGNRVQLVGRDPHMEAVRRDGLVLDGHLGRHVVRGIETATDLSGIEPSPPVTAVLISVKSYDTITAIRDLEESRLITADTLVVSLQNGLGNLELVREAFGEERSIGGRVIFGAQVTDPGNVHISVWADSVLLGGPKSDVGRRRVQELSELLTGSGLDTRAVEAIESALWGKVLYNIGLNPLSALLKVPYGKLGEEQNARGLLVALMVEAYSVASGEVILPWESADDYLDLFFSELLPSTESHLSSMLQDMQRGRETEIEAITGQVIRRADALGIQVPVNRVVYGLVKAQVAMAGKSRDS